MLLHVLICPFGSSMFLYVPMCQFLFLNAPLMLHCRSRFLYVPSDSSMFFHVPIMSPLVVLCSITFSLCPFGFYCLLLCFSMLLYANSCSYVSFKCYFRFLYVPIISHCVTVYSLQCSYYVPSWTRFQLCLYSRFQGAWGQCESKTFKLFVATLISDLAKAPLATSEVDGWQERHLGARPCSGKV